MFFTQGNSTLVHGLLGPATFEGTIGDNDIKGAFVLTPQIILS